MYNLDILEQIDPSFVPFEFISYAKVRFIDGSEVIMTGEQYAMIAEDQKDLLTEVRVILKVREIFDHIEATTAEILSAVFNN